MTLCTQSHKHNSSPIMQLGMDGAVSVWGSEKDLKHFSFLFFFTLVILFDFYFYFYFWCSVITAALLGRYSMLHDIVLLTAPREEQRTKLMTDQKITEEDRKTIIIAPRTAHVTDGVQGNYAGCSKPMDKGGA